MMKNLQRNLTKSGRLLAISKSCISMIALAAVVFNCDAVKLSVVGQEIKETTSDTPAPKIEKTTGYICGSPDTEGVPTLILFAKDTVTYEIFNEDEEANYTAYTKGISCSIAQYRSLKKSEKWKYHIFINKEEFLKQTILEIPSFNDLNTALKAADWEQIEEEVGKINVTIKREEYNNYLDKKQNNLNTIEALLYTHPKIEVLKVPSYVFYMEDPLFEAIACLWPKRIKYVDEKGNILDWLLTAKAEGVSYTKYVNEYGTSYNELPFTVKCGFVDELTSLFNSLSENKTEQKIILIITCNEFEGDSIGKIEPMADGIKVIINGKNFNSIQTKILKPIIDKANERKVVIDKNGKSIEIFKKLTDTYHVIANFWDTNNIGIKIMRGKNEREKSYYFVSHDTYCKLEENGYYTGNLAVKFYSCEEFSKLSEERQIQLKQNTNGVIIKLLNPTDKSVESINFDNLTEVHFRMSTEFDDLDVFKKLKAKHGSKIKAVDQNGSFINLYLNENKDVYFLRDDFLNLTSEGYQINNLIARFTSYEQFTETYTYLDTPEKKIEKLKKEFKGVEIVFTKEDFYRMNNQNPQRFEVPRFVTHLADYCLENNEHLMILVLNDVIHMGDFCCSNCRLLSEITTNNYDLIFGESSLNNTPLLQKMFVLMEKEKRNVRKMRNLLKSAKNAGARDYVGIEYDAYYKPDTAASYLRQEELCKQYDYKDCYSERGYHRLQIIEKASRIPDNTEHPETKFGLFFPNYEKYYTESNTISYEKFINVNNNSTRDYTYYLGGILIDLDHFLDQKRISDDQLKEVADKCIEYEIMLKLDSSLAEAKYKLGEYYSTLGYYYIMRHNYAILKSMIVTVPIYRWDSLSDDEKEDLKEYTKEVRITCKENDLKMRNTNDLINMLSNYNGPGAVVNFFVEEPVLAKLAKMFFKYIQNIVISL